MLQQNLSVAVEERNLPGFVLHENESRGLLCIIQRCLVDDGCAIAIKDRTSPLLVGRVRVVSSPLGTFNHGLNLNETPTLEVAQVVQLILAAVAHLTVALW